MKLQRPVPRRARGVPRRGAAGGRRGRPGEPAQLDHTLRLAEFAFDPLLQEPTLPAGWDRSLTAGPDLHLVQFDGPIPGDAVARLHAAGLDSGRYVYPNTYIVVGTGADRDALRGQARIRWTGISPRPTARVPPCATAPANCSTCGC